MRDTILASLTIAAVGAGCAEGTTGEPYALASGIYELATTAMDGDCILEDAITPGAEHVGKLARMDTRVSEGSVQLVVCDDFFEDQCMPEPFVEPISMIREGDDLYAQDPSWEVTGCSCFQDFRGRRDVTGVVVSDGRVELTWSFELPAAPAQCSCPSQACSQQITQRLQALGEGG